MDVGDVLYYKTDQAPGAIPNGTPVKKIGADSSDAHKDGDRAKVIGSIGPAFFPPLGREVYGYWVEWEDMPGVPVFVSGHRIQEASLQDSQEGK